MSMDSIPQFKKQRLTEWTQEKSPFFYCIKEIHFTIKNRYYLKVNGWKNIFQENVPKKQAGAATLISNEIGLKPKLIKTHGEGHFIQIKRNFYQDDVSSLNIYC
jgi:exonuclease III